MAPKVASGKPAAGVAKQASSTGGRRYLLKPYKAATVQKGKWYPTEDVAKPVKRAHKPTLAKLRASIKPGTVVILLAGRFKGRRAVVLQQLKSGLLLVTGPYAVNGVPLRRVNQSYVIATSTKLDVSKADLSKIDEKIFSAKQEKKEKAIAKGAEAFFAAQSAGAKSAETSEDRKILQASIDKAITLSEVQKAYLKARFTLTKNDKPHAMTF